MFTYKQFTKIDVLKEKTNDLLLHVIRIIHGMRRHVEHYSFLTLESEYTLKSEFFLPCDSPTRLPAAYRNPVVFDGSFPQ